MININEELEITSAYFKVLLESSGFNYPKFDNRVDPFYGIQPDKNKGRITIKNEYGSLNYSWADPERLESEESVGDKRNYLPAEWKHIIELNLIEASTQGKGYGHKLMEEFMKSTEVQNCDAVFLDPNPGFDYTKRPEQEVLDSLYKFYSKYGFRSKNNNSGGQRMWYINPKLPKITTDKLPS